MAQDYAEENIKIMAEINRLHYELFRPLFNKIYQSIENRQYTQELINEIDQFIKSAMDHCNVLCFSPLYQFVKRFNDDVRIGQGFFIKKIGLNTHQEAYYLKIFDRITKSLRSNKEE